MEAQGVGFSARSGHSALLIGSRVYVFGGYNVRPNLVSPSCASPSSTPFISASPLSSSSNLRVFLTQSPLALAILQCPSPSYTPFLNGSLPVFQTNFCPVSGQETLATLRRTMWIAIPGKTNPPTSKCLQSNPAPPPSSILNPSASAALAYFSSSLSHQASCCSAGS